MTTLELLDAAKARLGIESDYALAKRLGMTQQAISNYRSERSRMDDDACLKVADILGLAPFAVIAMANSERSKTPDMRARWLEIVAGFPTLSPRAKTVRVMHPAWL